MLKEKTKHTLSQYFKVNIVTFKHTNIYHPLKHWKTRQHGTPLLFPEIGVAVSTSFQAPLLPIASLGWGQYKANQYNAMEEKKLVSKGKVAKRKKKETNFSQPKYKVVSAQFFTLKQHSVSLQWGFAEV